MDLLEKEIMKLVDEDKYDGSLTQELLRWSIRKNISVEDFCYTCMHIDLAFTDKDYFTAKDLWSAKYDEIINEIEDSVIDFGMGDGLNDEKIYFKVQNLIDTIQIIMSNSSNEYDKPNKTQYKVLNRIWGKLEHGYINEARELSELL